MKYLFFPMEPTYIFEEDLSTKGVLSIGEELGGCFYDYIQNDKGALMGLRYWLGSEALLVRHPVFCQFEQDNRFHFHPDKGFVDLLVDPSDASKLRSGSVTISIVQDFGGDHVVRKGGVAGICFEIE